jgi:hypothetical protein
MSDEEEAWRGLTEIERDFLREYRGSIGDILSGSQNDAISLADAAAAGSMKQMGNRYPARTERLLVFAAIERAAKEARDALLYEILLKSFSWVKRERDGEWCGMAIEPYERNALAELAGLSKQTVTKMFKKAHIESLRAAMAEVGEELHV